jgi:NADH dehydrogenase
MSTRVLVVGGGFAGVACTRRLAGQPEVEVTLFDQHGFQQFQPLLYQVATAELTSQDVRFDLAHIFRSHENVTVRTSEVTSIDPDRHAVTLASGEVMTGDVLVLAAGTKPNFFKVPGADQHAFPLYSVADAEQVRNRVLQLFEDAAAKPELVDAGALNFVVVGGGPTGVETAGALSELVHDVMPHRFPHLADAPPRVILIDTGTALLTQFSAKAHDYSSQQLQRRGVTLRLGVSVKEVTPDEVRLSDGTTIATQLVLWGGGISAAPIAGSSGLVQGRGGRIAVRPDLTVPGLDRVYAIGDVAAIPYGDEAALPQLGSVAQQSGDWAAQNILAAVEGIPGSPLHYRDKGIMAMIGRKAAVAEVGEHRHELHGRFAFAAWLGVHAQLLHNTGAELNAFHAWAEEFYLRPHHRSAELLDPSTLDTPRIDWGKR